MAGLIALLQWQWRAYWRRLLRGGPAARNNLVFLALIAVAGFPRYIGFLRDVVKQTAAGNTSLLQLVLAGSLLMMLLPVWDGGGLALDSREMARFPVASGARFGLRVLSRFITPVSWLLLAACAASAWPLLSLRHPSVALLAYVFLTTAGFAAGVALADLSQTAAGARAMRILWVGLPAAVAVAWSAGVRTLPPLPSYLVIVAGSGNLLPVLLSLLAASVAGYAAVKTFPWMLAHAPATEGSGQSRSAGRMTLARRELRLQASFAQVRVAWVIAATLAFYLATTAHPEADALRVMLAVFALLSVASAKNSFGLDGVPGLDRFLIWPTSATRILAEKNKAFALVLLTPAVPLACMAAWRFGWSEGAADLFEAVAITMAVLAWGNITSVVHPENHSSASGGDILDAVIAMAAIALPAAASIAAMRKDASSAPWYVLGIAAVSGVLYVASLRWSAQYFERRHEQMRQGLT